ncbi:MAG: hypothetical protein JWM25_1407 [Thermoleophilia bacterium]|nr:hypothetical protein [Thermoleophilia bacterium]
MLHDHHPTPAPPHPSNRKHRPGRFELGTWGLPIVLVALLIALATWRSAAAGGGDDHSADAPRRATPQLVTRTWQTASIATPRGWVVLDRGADHVTWGSAARTHTVTLAATESSVLPLPGVVDAIARDAPDALPGATLQGRPVEVELGPAPRRDAAMLVRFALPAEDGGLKLAQVWRRDSRAGRDLVATWTSSDGRWPVDPARAVPSSTVR